MREMAGKLKRFCVELAGMAGMGAVSDETRKKMYTILLVTSLLMALAMGKGMADGRKYVFDDRGRLVGVSRENVNDSAEFSLRAEVTGDFGKVEKDVQFRPKVADGGDGEGSSAHEGDAGRAVSAEIDHMVRDAEDSTRKRIMLPLRLEDGTAIKWSHRDRDWELFVLFPVTGAVLAFMTGRRDAEEHKKQEKEQRREIVLELPRFTNQLMLMMNGGMILRDAFTAICESYDMEGDQMTFFQRELVKLKKSNDRDRVSTSELINELAEKYGVKELMRVASILKENERKGADIIQSLDHEGRYLWENRKNMAREHGKLMEMKMAYPLGLLLVVLIAVTMAPAMLGM